MTKCKIIAELRDDLNIEKRNQMEKYIDYLEKKFDVTIVNENEFVKKKSSDKYGVDFSSLMAFYYSLTKEKQNFKNLQFVDLEDGGVNVAV